MALANVPSPGPGGNKTRVAWAVIRMCELLLILAFLGILHFWWGQLQLGIFLIAVEVAVLLSWKLAQAYGITSATAGAFRWLRANPVLAFAVYLMFSVAMLTWALRRLDLWSRLMDKPLVAVLVLAGLGGLSLWVAIDGHRALARYARDVYDWVKYSWSSALAYALAAALVVGFGVYWFGHPPKTIVFKVIMGVTLTLPFVFAYVLDKKRLIPYLLYKLQQQQAQAAQASQYAKQDIADFMAAVLPTALLTVVIGAGVGIYILGVRPKHFPTQWLPLMFLPLVLVVLAQVGWLRKLADGTWNAVVWSSGVKFSQTSTNQTVFTPEFSRPWMLITIGASAYTFYLMHQAQWHFYVQVGLTIATATLLLYLFAFVDVGAEKGTDLDPSEMDKVFPMPVKAGLLIATVQLIGLFWPQQEVPKPTISGIPAETFMERWERRARAFLQWLIGTAVLCVLFRFVLGAVGYWLYGRFRGHPVGVSEAYTWWQANWALGAQIALVCWYVLWFLVYWRRHVFIVTIYRTVVFAVPSLGGWPDSDLGKAPYQKIDVVHSKPVKLLGVYLTYGISLEKEGAVAVRAKFVPIAAIKYVRSEMRRLQIVPTI